MMFNLRAALHYQFKYQGPSGQWLFWLWKSCIHSRHPTQFPEYPENPENFSSGLKNPEYQENLICSIKANYSDFVDFPGNLDIPDIPDFTDILDNPGGVMTKVKSFT